MPLTLPANARIDTIFLPRQDDSDWTTRNAFGPLSSGLPSWTDVAQGNMGNCFALAAIIAIACREGGPQFIQNILKDDEGFSGEIYFIGRLWDPAKNKYRYIKSRKAICVETGKDDPASKHNALWVSAIEIMLSCFDGWAREGGLTYDPDGAAWSRLGGGQEYNVFLCLTGRVPERHFIPDPVAEDFDTSAELNDLGVFRFGSEAFRDFQQKVSTGQLSWEVHDPAGQQFLRQYNDDIKKTWQDFLGAQFGKVLRREKFNELFVRPLLLRYEHIMPGSVLSYLTTISWELSGKRKHAQYSTGDEALYKQINTWCAQGKAVAAGTRKILSTKLLYGSAHGGEQMVKGLLGGHAYAVRGCVERDGHKYVRLINPWGSYVRSYDPQTLKPSAAAGRQGHVRGPSGSRPPIGLHGHGSFDLHLIDFTKSFESICAVKFH